MQQAGVCPKCSRQDLEYYDAVEYTGAQGDRYVCRSCGFKGEEIYHLTFSHHEDENGMEVIDQNDC